MSPVFPEISLSAVGPMFVLSVWAMGLLLLDLVISRESKHWMAYLTLLGLAMSFLAAVNLWGREEATLSGMLIVDNYAVSLQILFLLILAMTVLISVNFLPQQGIERGEYYPLALFSTTGMMIMASGGDLIVLALGLELLSIPLYILSAFAQPREDSEEAALKYFLLGAFSSAFLIYGIALTYGATGTTRLAALADIIGGGIGLDDPMLLAGVGLIIVGFGFKVAMVPFHMWTPDVYEGAPTPVTAFMSVGAKAGGVAAFLRVFVFAFPALQARWAPIIALLAAMTMILGNVVAVAQQNIKRMLAYSSIAHAGYILVGLAAGSEMGVASSLFYLFAYTFTNLGAFAVVIATGEDGRERLNLDDYAGLFRSQPLLAGAMAIFMLSLTGVPPTAGLVGKIYVFSAAIDSGLTWLAVIGVLTSVISAFFYLRVVVIMFMREPLSEVRFGLSPLMNLALAVAVLGTLILGIFPGQIIALAQSSFFASL